MGRGVDALKNVWIKISLDDMSDIIAMHFVEKEQGLSFSSPPGLKGLSQRHCLHCCLMEIIITGLT